MTLSMDGTQPALELVKADKTSSPSAHTEGNTASEVLPSKTATRPVGHTVNQLKTVDPAAEGAKVINHLRAGAKEVIAACMLVNSTLQRFQGSREAIDRFIGVLVEGNVISKREGDMGSESPQLSKFRKIGKHAPLLLRKEIFPSLSAGVSILYHVVLLYERLDGDEPTRIRSLSQILGQCEGGLTREYLIEQINEVKRARRAVGASGPSAATSQSPMGSQVSDPVDANAVNKAASQSAAGTRLADLVDAGRSFDLLLLTPRPRDIRRIAEDYADEATISRCLPIHELTTDSAVAVVVTRIGDLPEIAGTLLPDCGFGKFSHVLLPSRPTQSDIIDMEVIVVAERGRADRIRPLGDAWVADNGPLDPTSIATRLAPASGRKLHVFAPGVADGWTCVVGDDSWAERPSLR